MNTVQESNESVAVRPKLAVPDQESAIALVNRWLHTEVGMAVNASHADFNSATFSWHVPVQLAYPDTGPVGVLGDIFVNAATGNFLGLPAAEELEQRALVLAEALGLVETEAEDNAAAA